jgi:hypothetical protein
MNGPDTSRIVPYPKAWASKISRFTMIAPQPSAALVRRYEHPLHFGGAIGETPDAAHSHRLPVATNDVEHASGRRISAQLVEGGRDIVRDWRAEQVRHLQAEVAPDVLFQPFEILDVHRHQGRTVPPGVCAFEDSGHTIPVPTPRSKRSLLPFAPPTAHARV